MSKGFWVKFFVIWILMWIIWVFLFWGGVKLDLFFNPWLRGAPSHWYQFFTTKHYLTILYLNNFKGSLVVMSIFGFVISFFFSLFVAFKFTENEIDIG